MEVSEKGLISADSLGGILTSPSKGFKTITKKKLAIIEASMGEVDRAISSFAKRNTQTDLKLRSLTMLSIGSPYRTLRQILIQVEKKRSAVQEAYFNLLEERERIKVYKEDGTELGRIKAARASVQASAGTQYIEGALKDIGSLMRAYEEIKESHNIPDNWDESNMESEEIAHNIKGAFRNAIRDLLATGRPNHGTLEWLEQMGIGIIEAHKEVQKFIQSENTDYEAMMNFLDTMADKYKNNHKKVMQRLGIKTLIDEEWLYKEI